MVQEHWVEDQAFHLFISQLARGHAVGFDEIFSVEVAHDRKVCGISPESNLNPVHPLILIFSTKCLDYSHMHVYDLIHVCSSWK